MRREHSKASNHPAPSFFSARTFFGGTIATADFGAMLMWGLLSFSPLIDLRRALTRVAVSISINKVTSGAQEMTHPHWRKKSKDERQALDEIHLAFGPEKRANARHLRVVSSDWQASRQISASIGRCKRANLMAGSLLAGGRGIAPVTYLHCDQRPLFSRFGQDLERSIKQQTTGGSRQQKAVVPVREG